MNTTRRQIIKHSAVVAGLLAGTGLFPQYALAFNTAAFEAKSLNDAIKALGGGAPAESSSVTLTAPDIAENGAVVPVEITSGIAGTTAIALIAEKNATPLVADFDLSGGTQGFVSTRIKMGQTALIRAVVTAGGKSYTAAKEVKVTIGGCGG